MPLFEISINSLKDNYIIKKKHYYLVYINFEQKKNNNIS